MEKGKIINDPILSLPKSYEGDFQKFIKQLLDEYFLLLSRSGFPSDELIKLDRLIKGLKLTLEEYYNGQPYKAFQTLDETIKKCELLNLVKEQKFEFSRDFYRLRIKDSKYPLERKDLFHIPFEERGKVNTQRFSIPGFPSLYLSNSIYLAWEELLRPKLDTIQAARFRNMYQLSLMDLTTDRYFDGTLNSEAEKDLSSLLLWPLIMICSVKVKSHEDGFKPEYIIPQLLLQWIRLQDGKFIGIKFSSTHLNKQTTNHTGHFFNVVIPVNNIKETGYCSFLSSVFNMTDVLSWQLFQFSMGAPGISIKYDREGGTNPEIQRLELIKNNAVDYEYSPFATLELALQMMKLQIIKFES